MNSSYRARWQSKDPWWGERKCHDQLQGAGGKFPAAWYAQAIYILYVNPAALRSYQEELKDTKGRALLSDEMIGVSDIYYGKEKIILNYLGMANRALLTAGAACM